MPDAEDRIDALYELAPEEFVAARDQLAKDLRAEKDREGAKEVKALRRPTVTAWALNQFARRHRDEADALVRAGQEAVEAQERAISGGKGAKDELRAALRARHEAVQRASARVQELLSERGSAGAEAEVLDALTAAASDDSVAEELLAARLPQPLSASSGLGSLDALLAASVSGADRPADDAPDSEGEPEPEEEPDEPDEKPDEAEQDEAEADEQDAERAAQARAEAEREVEERRSTARKLQIRALQAEDAAADADAEVTKAERALAEAKALAEERRAEAERLRAEADQAQQDLEEAESRLED